MDASTTELQITVLPGEETAARAAADIIVALSDAASGGFSIALAGGETPALLYSVLAEEPYRSSIRWNTWDIWWGDERAVPLNDPMSNYGLAAETLLNRVPIATERIHRIHGEIGSRAAALAYESEVRGRFGGQMPHFDLVLLGIGEDGHTASLFPGTQALQETQLAVVPGRAPHPPHDRITLTLPAINAAQHILFLVNGREKARALQAVIAADEEDATQPPAALIRPRQGTVQYVVDEAAAVLLTGAPGH